MTLEHLNERKTGRIRRGGSVRLPRRRASRCGLAAAAALAALAVSCAPAPGDENLKASFAAQIEAIASVGGFARAGDELTFTQSREGDSDVAWRVTIDSVSLEPRPDDAVPVQGVVVSSWYADGELIEASDRCRGCRRSSSMPGSHRSAGPCGTRSRQPGVGDTQRTAAARRTGMTRLTRMTRRTTAGRCAVVAAAALAYGGFAPAAFAQPAASDRSAEVAATIAFTEGPTVDADGAVYFTDLRGAGRILKMGPDGSVTTFREPSHRANGLIFDNEWRLLACEGGNGADVLPRITRTNVETGEVEVLADHFEGKQLHQPNDLTIDGQGRVYFTDRPGANVTPDQTGVHGVYRIDPDGSIARILTEPEVERPNGIVISPDDATLYVIETAQQEGGRA